MKYTRIYEGGELAGYLCEKGYIEVIYGAISFYGNFQKDYKANGIRFHTLKEAKREIERQG